MLDAFFDSPSTLALASVTRLPADRLTTGAYRKTAQNGEYDLILFDRCGPATEEDMPRANTFFIGYPPPPWKLTALEKIRTPLIRGWLGRHPIMHYLSALHEIGVSEAFVLNDLPPRTPRLIESDGNRALLLTLSRRSFTDLVLTFPLINNLGRFGTNWPLLASFPLFMGNVVQTLGNVSDGSRDELIQPGQPKTIRPDSPVADIEITEPGGTAQKLKRGSRADFLYGGTEQTGVYQVKWDGQWQRGFAVNLLDAGESNIEPRPAVTIGAVQVQGSTEERPHPAPTRELWRWAVLLALIVVLAEWYIYNRRVYF